MLLQRVIYYDVNKNIRPAQCLARETPFFIAALALSNLAAMYRNCTMIDQFYNFRPYYVTITLQIEKYSLSFAHVGPDAP